jgi:hypothetical protein
VCGGADGCGCLSESGVSVMVRRQEGGVCDEGGVCEALMVTDVFAVLQFGS